MSNRKKSWIISILIHIIAALILFSINIQIERKAEKLPLEITYVPPPEEPPKIEAEKQAEVVPTQKEIKRPKKGIILPERRTPKYIPKTLPRLFITPEDSIRLWEKDIRRYFKEKEIVPFAGNKFEFLNYDHNEKYKKALEQDTLKMLEKILAANFEKFALSDEEIKNLQTFSDPTEEWLFRRQGGSQVLPILPLIDKGIQLARNALRKIFSRENPVRANLFLSDIEIQILKIIWSKRVVTPSTLYNSLPVYINLRLSSLASILIELESKNILVSRKGLHEYLYAPVVSKKDVIGYYIRNLIELEEAEQKNIPIRKDLKDSIFRKIELLNSELSPD